MQCYRCGAELKDKTLVCPKCGFIMKGAKKLEQVETVSFEDRINNASAEELRAIIFAACGDKLHDPKKAKPEQTVAKKGKKWATISLLSGIAACIFMFVPGFNSVAAIVFFILAFAGFGKCAGYRSNMALAGLVMTVVAVAGSWVYNAYAAPVIGKALGLIKETTDAGATAS